LSKFNGIGPVTFNFGFQPIARSADNEWFAWIKLSEVKKLFAVPNSAFYSSIYRLIYLINIYLINDLYKNTNKFENKYKEK
jgi:hypothetical protein